MIISKLLSVANELQHNLNEKDLDYEIMSKGVIWDEDRQLVYDVYKLIENYRNN